MSDGSAWISKRKGEMPGSSRDKGASHLNFGERQPSGGVQEAGAIMIRIPLPE
jgi:hypothetical protein